MKLASGLLALAFGCLSLQCRSGAHAPLAAASKDAVAEADADGSVDSDAAPESDPAEPEAKASGAKEQKELPRGGREIFPEHRLVGFCGTPGGPALGRLTGRLAPKAKQLLAMADKYGDSRKLLPVFELIAVVVMGYPGPDKKWRRQVPDSVVDDYLRIARESKGLLVLNIQPGHSDFMTELKRYERWLHEPDVGVALDPEWAMKGNQKPGKFYGQTTGAAINEVAEHLAKIVHDDDLPEKVLIYHQVNGYVVKAVDEVEAHPGIALVQGVDGLGPKRSKITTYNFLTKRKPASAHPGFKLFFDEDTRNGWKLMSPKEVLGLEPQPEYVMYE